LRVYKHALQLLRTTDANNVSVGQGWWQEHDVAWGAWTADNGDDPIVELALSSAWRAFVSGPGTVAARKRAGLGRCLGARV